MRVNQTVIVVVFEDEGRFNKTVGRFIIEIVLTIIGEEDKKILLTVRFYLRDEVSDNIDSIKEG